MDRAKGITAGLWQRSDQAPVFYVIAMEDNEDEQVNYTHINNCFNQTISEFVFSKRAATDVLLRSHSILRPQRGWPRLKDLRL